MVIQLKSDVHDAVMMSSRSGLVLSRQPAAISGLDRPTLAKLDHFLLIPELVEFLLDDKATDYQ